jgi:hypothetical protein
VARAAGAETIDFMEEDVYDRIIDVLWSSAIHLSKIDRQS